MPRLEVREIPSTSPGLAELMRACFLRAGLSHVREAERYALGSPKAWLGVAYHHVLQAVWQDAGVGESDSDFIDRNWVDSIAALSQRATQHPLDARFGSPETWPGYYLVYASVRLRAQDAIQRKTRVASRNSKGQRDVWQERLFSTPDGKLVGRPDVVTEDQVIDYKTGSILDEQEKGEVKLAYQRQLRIYAYLVKSTFGRWPKVGVLLPAAGKGVEITLDPAECEREAAAVLALLEAYQGEIRSRTDATELASPSIVNCKWCTFKLICPAFWRAASEDWSGHLDGSAIEGELEAEPLPINIGSAFILTINVRAGTERRGSARIGPFVRGINADVALLRQGDRVRVVSLGVRNDGRLFAGQRTVIERTAALPEVSIVSSA